MNEQLVHVIGESVKVFHIRKSLHEDKCKEQSGITKTQSYGLACFMMWPFYEANTAEEHSETCCPC